MGFLRPRPQKRTKVSHQKQPTHAQRECRLTPQVKVSAAEVATGKRVEDFFPSSSKQVRSATVELFANARQSLSSCVPRRRCRAVGGSRPSRHHHSSVGIEV
jgi:hypothetical protein